MKKALFAFTGIVLASGVSYAATDFSSAGEQIRSNLVSAQLEMVFDQTEAKNLVLQAQNEFNIVLKPAFQAADVARVQAEFKNVLSALKISNETQFAQARSSLWTDILNISYQNLERQVKEGNVSQARVWLGLREYRLATRFTSPDTDATLALESLENQKISSSDALTSSSCNALFNRAW